MNNALKKEAIEEQMLYGRKEEFGLLARLRDLLLGLYDRIYPKPQYCPAKSDIGSS